MSDSRKTVLIISLKKEKVSAAPGSNPRKERLGQDYCMETKSLRLGRWLTALNTTKGLRKRTEKKKVIDFGNLEIPNYVKENNFRKVKWSEVRLQIN